jgi:hypothetical protein
VTWLAGVGLAASGHQFKPCEQDHWVRLEVEGSVDTVVPLPAQYDHCFRKNLIKPIQTLVKNQKYAGRALSSSAGRKTGLLVKSL